MKKITEDRSAKRKRRKTTFEPAAAVGGTSSIDMFHFLVGLVPCYPVCRLLPAFVHRGFPFTPPFAPPSPCIYIGCVRVGWQRHCCKTCRSLRELDNQGTIFFFFGGRPQLVVELDRLCEVNLYSAQVGMVVSRTW